MQTLWNYLKTCWEELKRVHKPSQNDVNCQPWKKILMLAKSWRPMHHDITVFPWHVWWLLPNGPVSSNIGDPGISLSSKVNTILRLSHTYRMYDHTPAMCLEIEQAFCELIYVFMFNLLILKWGGLNWCCFYKFGDWKPQSYFRELDVSPRYDIKN